jgi:AAA domain/Ribonuclease R winged-helix domain
VRRRGARDKNATFTAAELMETELPPIKSVVSGILPEGVTFFAGRPKLGKTWLAQGLALAVATGGVALGTIPVVQGEVLYLALEDNQRRLKKRFTKLLSGDNAPPGLHMAVEWPRAEEGGLVLMEEFLTEHNETSLVIVDTFGRFKPRATGRRSQYDEDRDAVDPLISIAAEHNVAILLVHHLRETESDDPLDMIHGGAGLTGGADGAMVLKRKRGDADAFLLVDGREIDNPMELGLTWDQKTATWAIAGDAEYFRLSEERRAILTILEYADEPLGPKAITAMLNARGIAMKYGAVREMLSQMVKDGQVVNVNRGAYTLPNNPQNTPDIADKLTSPLSFVRMSAMSGHLREEDDASAVTCIHGLPGGAGCYLCDPNHPERKKQRGDG